MTEAEQTSVFFFAGIYFFEFSKKEFVLI